MPAFNQSLGEVRCKTQTHAGACLFQIHPLKTPLSRLHSADVHNPSFHICLNHASIQLLQAFIPQLDQALFAKAGPLSPKWQDLLLVTEFASYAHIVALLIPHVLILLADVFLLLQSMYKQSSQHLAHLRQLASEHSAEQRTWLRYLNKYGPSLYAYTYIYIYIPLDINIWWPFCFYICIYFANMKEDIYIYIYVWVVYIYIQYI